MTQKGFPSPTSVHHRNPYPVLPQQDTERLSLSWLGTTEKGFPHAISGRHRKASLAMIQLSWRGPEELPGMDLPLTSRRLGLLPRISAVSTRYQHTPGDEWENSWRANRNGLAYNMDKTPRLATLEESAAAALESPKKAQMLPEMPQRSPREIQSMDLTPTHTKHLGLLLPCKSLGWLPVQFSCLQGRPKHSEYSSEES